MSFKELISTAPISLFLGLLLYLQTLFFFKKFFKNDVLDQSPLDLLWLDHRVWPFMWRCREIPIRAAGLCWHADLCRNPAVTRARGKRRSLTLQHAGGEGHEKPHIYIEWYRSRLRVFFFFFFFGVPRFWIRSKAQSDWLLDDLSKDKKSNALRQIIHPSTHDILCRVCIARPQLQNNPWTPEGVIFLWPAINRFYDCHMSTHLQYLFFFFPF